TILSTTNRVHGAWRFKQLKAKEYPSVQSELKNLYSACLGEALGVMMLGGKM
ncbi:hypothetical protein Csa_005736, partial [Cucumis sativus]